MHTYVNVAMQRHIIYRLSPHSLRILASVHQQNTLQGRGYPLSPRLFRTFPRHQERGAGKYLAFVLVAGARAQHIVRHALHHGYKIQDIPHHQLNQQLELFFNLSFVFIQKTPPFP